MYKQITHKSLHFTNKPGIDISVANILHSLLKRDPSERLSWRLTNTPEQQPLHAHPFFVDGSRLIATVEPPIAPKYVADTNNDSMDEIDTIYQNRTGTANTRAKTKNEELLEPCFDKLTNKQNSYFIDFGYIM